MSSPVVRNWCEQTAITLLPEAPFQKTIGMLWQERNLPEVWSTMEYANASVQRMTIGKRAIWNETGSFTFNVLGKSGFGENAMLEMLQRYCDLAIDLRVELMEQSGQLGTLQIENVGTPNCEPYEAGNWLIATVVSVYTYVSVRGTVDE